MAIVDFWADLDALVQQHPVVVDRPAFSAHPTSPQYIYRLDYGYLEGTHSSDGEAVDVWVGTLPARRVVGIVCTVDGLKHDVEIKLLLGCSSTEIATVSAFFTELKMGHRVWLRDSPGTSRIDDAGGDGCVENVCEFPGSGRRVPGVTGSAPATLFLTWIRAWTKYPSMLQPGLVVAASILGFGILVWGSVTRSVATKRVLFWTMAGSIALVVYFFK